jgi:hypothetical protein
MCLSGPKSWNKISRFFACFRNLTNCVNSFVKPGETTGIGRLTSSLLPLSHFVLGIIQRNIDAVVGDLEETGDRSLAGIVKKLYANRSNPKNG